MGAKILLSIMMVISVCLVPISYAQCMSGIASVRPAIKADVSCPQDRISEISNPNVALAASDAVWKGPETCGTKYSIKCTGSAFEPLPSDPCTGESVTVTIVEHCLQQTYCNVAHATLGSVTFILPEAAYIKISNPLVPNITIEYERVY